MIENKQGTWQLLNKLCLSIFAPFPENIRSEKWSLLIFLWREIGFFNNDQVINHFKQHLFQKKKSKQSSFFFFFKTRKFEFKLHLFPHLIEGIQLIWQTETCIKSQHCVSNGYTWLRTSRECGNLSYEELKRIFFSF